MSRFVAAIASVGLLLQSLLCLAPTIAAAPQPSAGEAKTLLFYVGTYAEKSEEGIHLCQLDLETGMAKRLAGVKGVKNPSFQAIHPNKRFLYSVSETQDFDGNRSGAVSAFSIDATTGQLTLLNEEPSMGTSPCHIITDRAGKNVLVANYSSGSLAVLPIKPDGSLDIPYNRVQHKGSGPHPRQKGPHAHCINNDASDRFVVSADLGLDKVLIYRFHPNDHTLVPNSHMPFAQVKPGSGPRHFTFHPNGKFGYVINELSSTVTAFAFDSKLGTLRTLQDLSTLPADFKGQNSTAEVFLSPDGRFLYGSNRGHHSIAVFAVDPNSGKLTPVSHHATHGEQPRNFGIDPTGTFLLVANQRTGNVVVFRIDPDTGQLKETGHSLQLTKPVCITFLNRDH